MEHSSDNNSTFSSKHEFRRKLNRDPDKSFNKLSEDGKVLVSSLRTALEGAKQRIVRLRDENDSKDGIIEEERNHRIALEEKMEKYLVDLYQNSSVNDELHQRLPRAKKKGYLFQRNEDEEHDAASESSDVGVEEPLKDNHLSPSEPLIQPKAQLENQSGQSAGDVMTSAIAAQHSSQGHKTNGNQPLPNQATTHPPPSVYPAFPGNQQYPVPPYYAPLYPYHQYLHPSNPLASSSLTSIASSSYMGLPSVALTNQGGTQENSSSQKERIISADPNHADTAPEGGQHMQQQPTAMNSSVIPSHPYSIFNHPNGTASFASEGLQHVPPMPSLNLNAPMPQIPFYGSGFISTSQDRQDNVSHMTRLLQEISVLKMENKELKTELKENKRDLELLKLDAGQDDGKKNTEAINALIEEVRRAEEEGEKAVSQLMYSANEDRNSALHELDRIRLKAARRNLTLSSNSQTDGSYIEETEELSQNDFVDTTLASDSEMLNSETDEPKFTSLRIETLMEKQKEVARQQIAAVSAQRDDALEKVRLLRKQLAFLKTSEFPNAMNQNLQAKLRITEKERDIAVRKLQQLSQDMNEVTLMCNLQKPLLTDDINIHSSNKPASSNKWTNRNDNDNDKSHKTSAEDMMMEKADDENKKEKSSSKFEATMKVLERENVEKDKRIEQLEALVLRQRKKLNTLCAGPLLMDS